jgi:hypothetical protein
MHLVGVAYDGQAPVGAVDLPECACLDMVCGCRFSFRFLFPEGFQKADVTSCSDHTKLSKLSVWFQL